MNIIDYIEKQKPTMSITELLLLEVVRRLDKVADLQKVANVHAEAGLAWSKELADKFYEDQGRPFTG